MLKMGVRRSKIQISKKASEVAVHDAVFREALGTIGALVRDGRRGIYGDASRHEVLKQAGVERATHLVVTLPHSVNRGPLIAAARQMNPSLQILVRARYLRERRELEQAGASAML